MAKAIDDSVLDTLLNEIKNNCTRMTLCEGQPANYTEANTNKAGANKKLADVTMAPGDFTLANGDTSGRKVTVAAKSTVDVDVTGTGDHVALLSVTNTLLLTVTTTASSVSVDSAGTVDFAAWDIEVADPS